MKNKSNLLNKNFIGHSKKSFSQNQIFNLHKGNNCQRAADRRGSPGPNLRTQAAAHASAGRLPAPTCWGWWRPRTRPPRTWTARRRSGGTRGRTPSRWRGTWCCPSGSVSCGWQRNVTHLDSCVRARWTSTSSSPVDEGAPLLHHGRLPGQHLLGVEDVEEVDGHEEGHRDVLPHGVGHLVLRVDHRVLKSHTLVFGRFCISSVSLWKWKSWEAVNVFVDEQITNAFTGTIRFTASDQETQADNQMGGKVMWLQMFTSK